MENFVRMKDLERAFCVTKQTIYRWIREGNFPKPMRFRNSSFWRETEVIAIQKKLIDQNAIKQETPKANAQVVHP